ncbi:MAG TPA: hypothetical protein VLG09_03115 [Candidatus Saccharimonadales bacterium]|nr:hypothetical protein [Candidatus Saccharimonadales bacterium]
MKGVTLDHSDETRRHFNLTLTPEDRLNMLHDIQGLDTRDAPLVNQQLWMAVKLLIAENADLRRLVELQMERALNEPTPVTLDSDFTEALTPDPEELEESEEVPTLEDEA